MGVAADQLESETEQVLATIAEAIAALPAKHGKPLVGFSFRNHEDPFARMLYALGLPVLPDPGRAARALAALVAYRRLKMKIEKSGSN